MNRIRPGTVADADAVFRLLTLLATSYPTSRAAFDAAYPELIGSSSAHLLVAEDDDGIQGYVYAADVRTLFANGPITEILELYVEESDRRRGIGRRLVESVAASADNGARSRSSCPRGGRAPSIGPWGSSSQPSSSKLRLAE